MKMEVLDIILNSIEKVKNFTDYANRINCDIDVIQGRYTVDAKSIMGVFSLNLVEPVSVRIISDDDIMVKNFLYKMEEFR